MELKKTKVIFDEENHKYYIEDTVVELSGITGRLGKSVLFRDKFNGIPEHILKNKAKFGSMVHKQLENYVLGEPYLPIAEITSFEKVKQREEFICLEPEFLVSDMTQYATMIDLLTIEKDGSMAINDHKTTFKLDKEFLSWQMSICRYLFEKQTGKRIERLFAIHFKDGNCRRIEIEHKTDLEVYDMLYTDKYMNSELPSEVEATITIPKKEIATLEGLEKRIISVSEKLMALENEKAKFLSIISEKMEAAGIDKVKFGKIVITISKPYTRTGIDTAKLLAEHPELDGKYVKTTTVKGSVKLKIEKDD